MTDRNENMQGSFKGGQCHIVRLKFLADFMKTSGITKVEVAEKMCLTRQAVHHWFLRDDMRLSHIYSLFEKFGYRIEFSLGDGSSALNAPGTSGQSDGMSGPYSVGSMSRQPDVTVTMTLMFRDSHPKLAFLKSALEANSISKETLAERLRISRATVFNWFKADDCFLSYIYEAAFATGLRLSIRIFPL